MIEDVVVRNVNCTLSARSCHFDFDEPSAEGKEQTRPVICIAVSKTLGLGPLLLDTVYSVVLALLSRYQAAARSWEEGVHQ